MESQLKAEREKRARVARSEGVMEARVNAAKALREEIANQGLGEKRRIESEAEAKAAGIVRQSKAAAEAIARSREALALDGGEAAARYSLSRSSMRALDGLARKGAKITLGANLALAEALPPKPFERKTRNGEEGE